VGSFFGGPLSLQPLYDRVLVKRVPVTESKGIIIPGAAGLNQTTTATVIDVGPGRTEAGILVPMTVKVGDVILLGQRAGVEVDVEVDGDKVTLAIINETDILAIYK
jgi:chaperonin GroES